MSVSQKYYLLITGPNGNEQQVQVDPSKVGPDMLKMYTRDRSAGARQFIPALFELPETAPQSQPHDMAVVIERFNERRLEIEDILENLDDSGTRLGAVTAAIDLPAIIKAIESRDPKSALGAVDGMMYKLMSILTDLAEERAKHRETVEGLSGSMEAIATDLDQNASPVVKEHYNAWGVACLEVNDAIGKLAAVEADLKSRHVKMNAMGIEWNTLLTSHDGPVISTQRFLNEGDDPFLDLALTYRGELESRDAVLAAIRHAKDLIGQCRGLEQKVDDAWEAFGAALVQEVRPLERSIDGLCELLRENSRIIMTFETSYSRQGVPRPYEMSHVGLTEAQYKSAIAWTKNQDWSPRGVKDRLTYAASTLHMLLKNKPRLPAELVTLIGLAEKAIRSAEECLEQPTATKSVAPVANPVTVVTLSEIPPTARVVAENAVAVMDDDDGDDEHEESIEAVSGKRDPVRTAELIELVICVYYVLTSLNARFLSATNVKNAMAVVEELGRCTERERRLYLPSIQEHYEAERERVDDTKRIIERQKKSTSRWIYFKIRSRWLSKLTHACTGTASILMQKHRLDPPTIRGAYDNFRERKREEHKQKKSVASS